MATILKNTSYASVFFGANSPGQTMYQIPRVKYMFYANFQVSPEALSMFSNLNKISNWQGGVSFKIRTIDKPNIDLQQRELNQYNRKRYAYTKTEYKPVSISIYDTVDNAPLTMWVEYFNYYFGDARYKSAATMGTSVVDPTFDDSTGWGLRPLVNQIQFFTALNIYALYGSEYTLTTYLNPKVSSIDFGNHDTSSSDLEDFRMTLTYETLQYNAGTLTVELAEQFGLFASPYIEPSYTPAPIPTAQGPTNLSGVDYQPSIFADRPNITSPIAAAPPAAGVSGANYTAIIASSNKYQPGTDLNVPAGQVSYVSASAASDVVYGPGTPPRNGATTIGGNPSNFPIPENYGLTGLPQGQLPNIPQYVQFDEATEFTQVTGSGIYNLLGTFGAFNFGGGRVLTTVGANYSSSYDPVTGTVSYRPGVPDDAAQLNAQPTIVPGQQIPSLRISYHNQLNSNYGPDGPRYLTQRQQIEYARRRVQQGQVSLTLEIGNPAYDQYGVFTGYDQSYYQPAPDPVFGVNLSTAAALSNNTVSGFGYLDDPGIYGGDPSDNEPPPVAYPYQNENLDGEVY